MQRIDIDPAHEAVFAQEGLRTFEAFIGYDRGRVINRNEKRDVTILELGGTEEERVYYMKRFFRPHLKDMLFTLRSFGRLCSQAELEWRNARFLLDNGIETYRPIAWGTETCCGVERRSFFITEKINGRSLIEMLFERWDGFDAAQRHGLVVAMAQFFGRLHRARVNLPDAYLWHLFVLEPIVPAGPYTFAMIDLHRMQSNTDPSRYAARNLAALLYSLPDEWFDAPLRTLFIDTYLASDEESFITHPEAFRHSVHKREQIIIARRKKPDLKRLRNLA
jgi:hypothetical protein